MMTELQQWWAIARDIGAGATFVLGAAAAVLWRRLIAEQEYARQRDKETLLVLNGITGLLGQGVERDNHMTDKLLAAIERSQNTIIGHLTKTRRS